MLKNKVVRIMEYIGDQDWLQQTLSNSAVPLNGVKYFADGTITCKTIDGTFEEFNKSVYVNDMLFVQEELQ